MASCGRRRRRGRATTRDEAKGEEEDEDDSHVGNDADAERYSSFFPLSSICICVGADTDAGRRRVEAADVDALYLR